MYIANDETGISNKKLYDQIIDYAKTNVKGIKKLFYKKLTVEEIEKINQIHLYGIEDKDLRFLKFFKNLKHLSLDNCKFSSTYGLQYVVQLETLFISDSEIDDLGYIRDCYNLEMFDYMFEKDCEFKHTNFECISNLSKLVEVDLTGNNVRDVSFLSNLQHLTEVVLNENPVENLEVLKDLPELVYVEVEDCGLTSLEWVKEFKKLNNLYTSGNLLSEEQKEYYKQQFKHIQKLEI